MDRAGKRERQVPDLDAVAVVIFAEAKRVAESIERRSDGARQGLERAHSTIPGDVEQRCRPIAIALAHRDLRDFAGQREQIKRWSMCMCEITIASRPPSVSRLHSRSSAP